MSRPGTEGREANPWTQPDETLWSQRNAHPRVRTETWRVHPQSILNPSCSARDRSQRPLIAQGPRECRACQNPPCSDGLDAVEAETANRAILAAQWVGDQSGEIDSSHWFDSASLPYHVLVRSFTGYG
ncbi:hypothetical protein PABG_11603 [Paracoccidioides brasiliensis Pb03]|nr:hypothetical protein PABG_11603 [Paracoccidioides brasiliensis Pb03]